MKMRNLFYAIVIFGPIVFMPGILTAEEPNSSSPGQKKEKAMTIKLQWFGHASFKITDGNSVIYIDPWKLKESNHDATLVLVSHSH